MSEEYHETLSKKYREECSKCERTDVSLFVHDGGGVERLCQEHCEEAEFFRLDCTCDEDFPCDYCVHVLGRDFPELH